MPRPERFPPSEYLNDMLQERGWSSKDIAEQSHLHLRVIEDVLYHGRPISPRIADGLAFAFNTSPDVWLNLQRAYDERNEP